MPLKTPSTPAKLSTPRLTTVSSLHIRRPNRAAENPCVGILSSVLNCWASSNYSQESCGKLEQALKACTDQPKAKQQKKNTINYHLARLYPKISGPRKKQR